MVHIGQRGWVTASLVLFLVGPALGQVVPGTGRRVTSVGDNFEDPKWSFIFNGKKSSRENDGRVRSPTGRSRNGRWIEGVKRGYPDKIERVATPAGGLPGSQGSLLLRSRDTGIPGRITRQQQQDDFMVRSFSVSTMNSPSFVVRVHLPEFDEWENRSGSTFGFRTGVRASQQEQVVKRFIRGRMRRSFELVDLDGAEAYWPGMFIQFLSKHAGEHQRDSAILVCRAARTGKEFPGISLEPGWWTLGLSFTSDGAIHYYASKGVDRLTEADRIGSSFAYNYRAETVTSMFFNICSPDDGKTWSTPWVIDDPTMFTLTGGVGGGVVRSPERSRSGGLFGKLFR